jgi:hypothetical protein
VLHIEGSVAPIIEEDKYLAAIVGVDDSGGVRHKDRSFLGEATTGTHKDGITARRLND